MIGAPNTENLNFSVRVLKGAPRTSVSAEIFRNYYIDDKDKDKDNKNKNENNN